MLERLHFPPEWRALFDAAGVPPAALEDIQSTRTLVDFVAQSLEAETLTKLRNEFKESDSGRGVSVSPPEHPTVLPTQTYSTKVEEIQDLDDGADHESGIYEASRPSSMARSYRSASISNDLTDFSQGQHIPPTAVMPPPPPPVPPPPPPPPVLPPLPVTPNSPPLSDSLTLDLQANLAGVTLKHIPEGQTSGDPNDPSGLPFMATDLMQQKMKLKPPDPASSPVPKPVESAFYINPADLMTQKGRLKHIEPPAPSQLKDLSAVDGGQLNNIADILKKVSQQASLRCM